ncbi:MAG: type II toxin-antitoxin system VapB family antitoxin [Vulcanimicrobiota bacterium]
MALNIKNEEVERLASEVAALTGETKTEAVRKALEERRRRLTLHRSTSERNILQTLEAEIWSALPPEALGQGLAYEAIDGILGFGPEGY